MSHNWLRKMNQVTVLIHPVIELIDDVTCVVLYSYFWVREASELEGCILAPRRSDL